jgi:hypothetical protein
MMVEPLWALHISKIPLYNTAALGIKFPTKASGRLL